MLDKEHVARLNATQQIQQTQCLRAWWWYRSGATKTMLNTASHAIKFEGQKELLVERAHTDPLSCPLGVAVGRQPAPAPEQLALKKITCYKATCAWSAVTARHPASARLSEPH